MKALTALAALTMVLGCGSSSGTDDGGNPNDSGTKSDGGTSDAGSGGYRIGGTLLTAGASSLVLATPGEPNLTIPNSYEPPFAFANKVPSGTAYNVTIFSQPTSPPCTGVCTCVILDGGVGVVGNADVTSVLVACAIQLP